MFDPSNGDDMMTLYRLALKKDFEKFSILLREIRREAYIAGRNDEAANCLLPGDELPLGDFDLWDDEYVSLPA